MVNKFLENPDLLHETLIPIAKVGKHFPKPVAPGTTIRFSTKGVGGIRLETARIGSRRFSSLEAIERFLIAQNQAPKQPVSTVTTMSESERKAGRKHHKLPTPIDSN